MPDQRLDLTLDLIARAHPTPVADDATALALMSDAELAPGLAAAFAARPLPAEGLWVFGYGSLIWRPEFTYSERRVGTVHGYHRRFCLLQRRFRGSVDNPGLVLALDAGGSCDGVAFRLTGDEAAETLLPVWRREMRGNGYIGRWVTVETAAGQIQALTFVVNPDSDRYTGPISDAAIADRIASGAGHLGPSAEYLFRTVSACLAEGIRCPHLLTLQGMVAERLRARLPRSGNPDRPGNSG
ncbi:calcium transporter ChaC [Methylobacterium sp. Leaf104]|uniref:gamma-glutamylcyclotransferase n=1 Tax=Methylobacterium TaxID=407 RepID=UPI0006F31165|nr:MULTISPECIES: gamma-glutamylcyclotransferase [Methylobacterium]KQP42368.1 calcium transporter ChaC [Methylobacterium sp. Leaf104]MCI9879114.1 gamma-glutamylcyclotransferase [Methylobacterium goesingense]